MLADNQYIHVNIKLHVYKTSSYYLSISDYKQFWSYQGDKVRS